jgi:hypothetical protein
LQIHSPVLTKFDGLELLGYNLYSSSVIVGEGVNLTLFWRSIGEMSQLYLFKIELLRGKEKVVEGISHPGGKVYPTTEWKGGEVIRTQLYFLIPAMVSEGEYRLQLTIIEESGEEVAPPIPLGDIIVKAPERTMEIPSIQNPMRFNLEGLVTFLGYDLDKREAKPGDSLHLVLYWRAEREMRKSYKVFTHLLDERGRIWAQKDNIPCNWTRPTTGWVEGEVISDGYELIVEEGALFGEYVLEVGMYEEATGERLKVFDERRRFVGDRILLGKVEVGSLETP